MSEPEARASPKPWPSSWTRTQVLEAAISACLEWETEDHPLIVGLEAMLAEAEANT